MRAFGVRKKLVAAIKTKQFSVITIKTTKQGTKTSGISYIIISPFHSPLSLSLSFSLFYLVFVHFVRVKKKPPSNSHLFLDMRSKNIWIL